MKPSRSRSALLLDAVQASLYARLALSGVTRPYPNHPQHVMLDSQDLHTPRQLHPAFYGCFDWHSAVHSHWLLACLLRSLPQLPEAGEMRAALDENLSAANLQIEADYFARPGRQSFERMYGWAWLLKLAQELHDWQDAQGAAWYKNLQPLAAVIVARYQDFLPKQIYTISTGLHPNTAFGLTFALDYARACRHPELEALIVRRGLDYFAQDADYPACWEPGGTDFLSPALVEADLMSRILPPAEFQAWFERFLPGIAAGEPQSLLAPVSVSDRSDPLLVHLDGLNLSRAWCMRRIAAALPERDPARPVLAAAAERHAQEGLAQVASGDYVGEHWLASFAVYLLTTPLSG